MSTTDITIASVIIGPLVLFAIVLLLVRIWSRKRNEIEIGHPNLTAYVGSKYKNEPRVVVFRGGLITGTVVAYIEACVRSRGFLEAGWNTAGLRANPSLDELGTYSTREEALEAICQWECAYESKRAPVDAARQKVRGQ